MTTIKVSGRRDDFVASPPTPPVTPRFKPELGEMTSMVARLVNAGVDVADLGVRAEAVRVALEAVVTVDVERHHKTPPLLSDKPAKVADRLRAAAIELAAQDAMNRAFRWFTAKMVDELTEGLRDRSDDIAAMLRSTFAAALAAVTEAADAGVRPTTTAADALAADDDRLADAFRRLPVATAKLNANHELRDELASLGVVVVDDDLPPANRGLILTPQPDGGQRWQSDRRTGAWPGFLTSAAPTRTTTGRWPRDPRSRRQRHRCCMSYECSSRTR